MAELDDGSQVTEPVVTLDESIDTNYPDDELGITDTEWPDELAMALADVPCGLGEGLGSEPEQERELPFAFVNEMLKTGERGCPGFTRLAGSSTGRSECDIPSPARIGIVASASKILVNDSIYDLAIPCSYFWRVVG